MPKRIDELSGVAIMRVQVQIEREPSLEDSVLKAGCWPQHRVPLHDIGMARPNGRAMSSLVRIPKTDALDLAAHHPELEAVHHHAAPRQATHARSMWPPMSADTAGRAPGPERG